MKRSVRNVGLNRKARVHHPGQSLVEFALILPLFVLMVVGIFDLGRAFFSSITITNAAREGARFGTLNADQSVLICQHALSEVRNQGFDLDDLVITIACDDTLTCSNALIPPPMNPAGCNRGQPITVTASYTFDELVLGFFFPGGIHMQRSVEMQVP
jgi:hypothetical protein